jgi:phosphohistidine phosphatase
MVHADQRLYEGGPLRLLEVVSEVDDSLNSVLLVGHNPVLEEFVQLLTAQTIHLSPGNLAQIDIDATQWSGMGEMRNTLRRVVRPKDLPTSN